MGQESGENLGTMGVRVRHYRERLGLSQEEPAARVGAAQQTIQPKKSGCPLTREQVTNTAAAIVVREGI